MIRLLSIKAPLPCILKQQRCCAWQIRNKHHLKEEGGIWMSESKPGAGILSCRWRRRGEASFSIHEVSWPFACHARAVCVQLNVHASVCVHVCEGATGMHLRPTHTFLYSVEAKLLHRRKNMSMCVSALGAKCVCALIHTRARTHTSIYDVHAGCEAGWRRGGSTVYNPPPTMYDPFVFCDRRGRKKKKRFT